MGREFTGPAESGSDFALGEGAGFPNRQMRWTKDPVCLPIRNAVCEFARNDLFRAFQPTRVCPFRQNLIRSKPLWNQRMKAEVRNWY